MQCLTTADSCVDVLEHVAHLQQTLVEIYRVLKPGGVSCFDTINYTVKSKLILIWLLGNVLQLIPSSVHDQQKFIKPAELTHVLYIGKAIKQGDRATVSN